MEVKQSSLVTWTAYFRNIDVVGYCAGIRMQMWVWHRLRKICPEIPEFVEGVHK